MNMKTKFRLISILVLLITVGVLLNERYLDNNLLGHLTKAQFFLGADVKTHSKSATNDVFFFHNKARMFRYMASSARICHVRDDVIAEEPVLVIGLIYSAPNAFERRQKMRLQLNNTNDKHLLKKSFNIRRNRLNHNTRARDKKIIFRHLFVLGQTLINSTNGSSAGKSSSLIQEQEVFGDLIQGNFVDSYFNISVKSVYILNWVQKYCKSAAMLVKLDDDITLNVTTLLKMLTKLASSSNMANRVPFIYGYVRMNNPVIRDKVDRWGKYYVPYSLYPNPDKYYPPHVDGFNYIMSASAVDRILLAASKIHSYGIDDTYITGVCRKKARVKYIHDYRFCSQGALPEIMKTCISYHKF